MKENKNLPGLRRRRPDKLMSLLVGTYFLGVVLGTILYCTADDSKAGILDRTLRNFISGRMENNFWETAVNSFSGGFLLLVICFVSGLCLIAEPLEIFIPLFGGIGAGTAIAGMYGIFGIPGIGASAILIVPDAVLSALVIIIASREAVRFSAALFSSAFIRAPEREYPDVRLYLTKFVILCGGLGISSFADSIITFAFAGLWTSLIGQ